MSVFAYNHMEGDILIELFKVLGDENRLRIINLLTQKELCVCEIELLLNMTQSNVSRHLAKLKSVDIISSKRDAQWVHYKIDEQFKKQNEGLVGFLMESFTKNDLYVDDVVKYKEYKKHNLNCKYITESKEKVLEIINRRS